MLKTLQFKLVCFWWWRLLTVRPQPLSETGRWVLPAGQGLCPCPWLFPKPLLLRRNPLYYCYSRCFLESFSLSFLFFSIHVEIRLFLGNGAPGSCYTKWWSSAFFCRQNSDHIWKYGELKLHSLLLRGYLSERRKKGDTGSSVWSHGGHLVWAEQSLHFPGLPSSLFSF